MKRGAVLLGSLLLLPALGAGCGTSTKTVTAIQPRNAPVFRDLKAADVTQPFVDRGYDLVESHDQSRRLWNCRQKRADNIRVFVHVTGSAPDRIEEIHAAFMHFGQANREEEARDFFAQVARAVCHGRQAADLADWIREKTGGADTAHADSLEFRVNSLKNAFNFYIRPDPEKPGIKQVK